MYNSKEDIETIITEYDKLASKEDILKKIKREYEALRKNEITETKSLLNKLAGEKEHTCKLLKKTKKYKNFYPISMKHHQIKLLHEELEEIFLFEREKYN